MGLKVRMQTIHRDLRKIINNNIISREEYEIWVENSK